VTLFWWRNADDVINIFLEVRFRLNVFEKKKKKFVHEPSKIVKRFCVAKKLK